MLKTGAKIITVVIAALAMPAVVAAKKPPKPDFSERSLRPVNDDLAAWLARLNAVPERQPASPGDTPAVPAAAPDVPAPAPAIPLPPVAVAATTPPPPAATAATPSSPPATPVSATAAPLPSATQTAIAAAAPTSGAALTTAGATLPIAAMAAIATTSPRPPPLAWEATPTDTLRSALEAWSARAGWRLVWDADVDYAIQTRLEYDGDFLAAVRGVMRAHLSADRPLRVEADPTLHVLKVRE